MKRLTALFLALVMVFGLAACSSASPSSSETSSRTEPSSTLEPSSETASDAPAPSATEPVQPESTEEEPEAGTGGTLVVYFSATGNTEEAANMIAQITGGDLFELEPVELYTDEDLNYNDEGSRVVYEHDNPAERETELVADTVEHWDSYDTVFIGYPIWWGIAAWPVDTFIEANDFTGKTVIPFCTSASSGLGESGELLAEMAGTGDWLEGHRFSSSVSEEDVQAWLDTLEI